jgi:hypothetical protein
MHEIHPDDERALLQVLQRTELPDDLKAEYLLCRRMYCAIGSGPMQVMWLIEMCRRLGYEPNAVQKIAPPRTNWRRLPQDGTIDVAVRDEREGEEFWVKGRFFGFVTAGSFCIDVAGTRREVAMKNVRLYESPSDLDVMSTRVLDFVECEKESVFVDHDNDLKDGTLVGHTSDGEPVVVLAGETSVRVFPQSAVTSNAPATA